MQSTLSVRCHGSKSRAQATAVNSPKYRRRDTRKCVECGTGAMAADIRLTVPMSERAALAAGEPVYMAWLCAGCRVHLPVTLVAPKVTTEQTLSASERAALVPRRVSPPKAAKGKRVWRVVDGVLDDSFVPDPSESTTPALSTSTPERYRRIAAWEEGHNTPEPEPESGNWLLVSFGKAPRQLVSKKARLTIDVPFEHWSAGVNGSSGTPVRNIVRVAAVPKRRRPDLYTNF